MENKEITKIEQNVVVTLNYSLVVNEQEIDSGPIQYIHGHENIIPGLESEIEGMQLGEEKEVFVKAKDAYGEYDPDLEWEVSRDSFPADFEIKLGEPMRMQDGEGRMYTAVAIAITNDNVRLNLNHPLAGKDLLFKTRVDALRMATDEEIEHGHTHQGCSGCSSGDCSDC